MKKEEPTTKKEEPTIKKPEAKSEGAAPKHLRVVYSDKRKNKFYIVPGLVFLLICIFAFSYVAIEPRVPQFIFKDLYVDPLSNSSVLVKLSSTNPSSKSRVYYSKMSLHLRLLGEFETESVFLGSTFQEPHEVTTWTAKAVDNKDNVRPSGSFLVRHGVANGEVIADMLIQWKRGFFMSSKLGLHVRCPVVLKLEDLSSAITIPSGSTCSQHL